MRVVTVVKHHPLLLARGRVLHERAAKSPEIEALRRAVLHIFEQVAELSRTLPRMPMARR